MQCATESEIDNWLNERAIPKDPYYGEAAPEFYLQFHAPPKYRWLDAFTRHYYERIIPESESLIHITDCALYQPSEMIAITGIRRSRGEDRLLIEVPGHSLILEEVELGISLFSLAASFAWSSYLYSPANRSTLHNWEGEIFDFWTDSKQCLAEMGVILREFDLEETTKEKPW